MFMRKAHTDREGHPSPNSDDTTSTRIARQFSLRRTGECHRHQDLPVHCRQNWRQTKFLHFLDMTVLNSFILCAAFGTKITHRLPTFPLMELDLDSGCGVSTSDGWFSGSQTISINTCVRTQTYSAFLAVSYQVNTQRSACGMTGCLPVLFRDQYTVT